MFDRAIQCRIILFGTHCTLMILISFRKTNQKNQSEAVAQRLWHRCFPVNFCEISMNPFSYRTTPVAASESVILKGDDARL